MAITLDENGQYKSMERFLPDLHLKGPIDMKFGPDGSLYVIEYGNGYFKDNPEAELIRIEYNGGNRRPIVQAASKKLAGAVPFTVALSSEGTNDFDGDELKYDWKITKKGATVMQSKQANPSFTLTQPGEYRATLTVRDPKGATNSKSITLHAGNEPPKVKINFNQGNRSFYFPGKPIRYAVDIQDKEDGSLANKRISPAQVAVSIDYLTEGFDLTEIAQSQRSVDASVQHARAVNMISKSDCRACHAITTKSLGPSFTSVAAKYRGKTNAVTPLAKKIISGGSGVWGDAMMPAHSTLSEADSKAMVNYILSLGTKNQTVKSRPVQGNYTTVIPAEDKGKGSVIFRAAYTDRGTKLSSPQASEDLLVLRNPVVPVADANTFEGIDWRSNKAVAVLKTEAMIAMNAIDLTSLKTIEFITAGSASGMNVELHIDSPGGKLVGKAADTKLTLEEVTGIHDIYFVFRNEKPVQIRSIKFGDQ